MAGVISLADVMAEEDAEAKKVADIEEAAMVNASHKQHVMKESPAALASKFTSGGPVWQNADSTGAIAIAMAMCAVKIAISMAMCSAERRSLLSLECNGDNDIDPG